MKQTFHADMKKVFKPVTESIKDVSEDVTRTRTETSKENNKGLSNLTDKLLEILNDVGILAFYLFSPLSIITNRDPTSRFELVNDPDSKRVNDLLINKTKPVTLYDNLLTFREKFRLKGGILKMITNKNYNKDLANLSDKNILFEFAKEKSLGNKITRDKALLRLLISPVIKASDIFTTVLPENLDDLCDRLKLLL